MEEPLISKRSRCGSRPRAGTPARRPARPPVRRHGDAPGARRHRQPGAPAPPARRHLAGRQFRPSPGHPSRHPALPGRAARGAASPGERVTLRVLFLGEGTSDSGITDHVQRIATECAVQVVIIDPLTDRLSRPPKRTVAGKQSSTGTATVTAERRASPRSRRRSPRSCPGRSTPPWSRSG